MKIVMFLSLVAWTQLLFALSLPNPATLYILPSENHLAWNTPEELAVSSLKNAAFSQHFGMRFIDHMVFELKCAKDKKPLYLAFTFDDAKEALDQIYSQGIGYRILFEKYKGKLETQKEIIDQLDTSLKGNAKDRIIYLNFPVTNTKCESLHARISDILKSKSLFYTLYNDHKAQNATNCTKLIISLLEQEKILSRKSVEKLITKIYVPNIFIGSVKQKVYPQTVYFSDYKSVDWQKPLSIPATEFTLINPAKITTKIKEITKESANTLGLVLKGDLDEFFTQL